VLGTHLGVAAANSAIAGDWNVLVRLEGIDVSKIPLDQVTPGIKKVPTDGNLIQTARAIGISLGDG